ncbi:30S ribosomal protein S16 [Patescibacteria group bacterium]|nr:MAG: 30S ribosomal protein S16 [Patescibacteria group bacterium]
MLTIRLSRTGKTKQPYYRLIVSEKARDPWGVAVEILGNYNPRTKKADFDAERVRHWLSRGAQTSDTVWNLLLSLNLVEGKKRQIVPPPKKDETKKEAEPAAVS